MKSIKKAITGALVLAVAGSGLLAGASAASAAAVPGFEPDANSLGSLTFYDASGNVVTSGTNLNHLFDYAAASSVAARPGTTKASLSFGFPDHTKADSSTWFSSSASAATAFPNTSAPAPINGFGRRPVANPGPNDANLGSLLSTTILDQTAGYKDLVEVRVKDTGPGSINGTQPQFWNADIQFDQANGTWTQVYPAVAATTNTTLVASPSPSTVGNTVTLTATESPAAPGSVQFNDGGTPIGATVPVNGSGVATTTVSTLAAGPHTLTAVFTPTDPTAFGSSTGTASTTVNPAATATTTALAVSGGYLTAGTDATLTANVTGPGATPNGADTVAFYDNGATSPVPGTVVTGPTGTYTLDLPAGFTAGAHSVVAKFTPTDVAQFAVSQSSAQAFTTAAAQGTPCAQPGSVCTDPQPIQATVPVGTLVINTPYTAASPLDLGTLALSPDATQFTGSAKFTNIRITDTRTGNLPWTAKALSSPLTDGGTHGNSVINAQNVGLTALTSAAAAGFTGNVVTSANPAANGVAPNDAGSLGLGGATAHTIATADHGQGTVTLKGTLTINAPSSTEAGLFTGIITFTAG